MTTPPLPPQVIEHAEAYKNAVAITRATLTGDLTAITQLWLGCTQQEQLSTIIAAGHMINELVASHYVIRGDYPADNVPLAAIAAHHDQILTRLATADNTRPAGEA